MAQDTKIPNGRVERLHQQLAGLMHDPTGRLPDVPDVWDTVFDITAVRCGSLRLPFNDKWHHPSEATAAIFCGVIPSAGHFGAAWRRSFCPEFNKSNH